MQYEDNSITPVGGACVTVGVGAGLGVGVGDGDGGKGRMSDGEGTSLLCAWLLHGRTALVLSSIFLQQWQCCVF